MTSKRTIPTRRFIKPTFEFLIEKKRDGGEFNQDEIRYIIEHKRVFVLKEELNTVPRFFYFYAT